MSRATAPQVSFADWELMLQGSTLDPLLAEISELLDREEEAIEDPSGSGTRLETAGDGTWRLDSGPSATLAGVNADKVLGLWGAARRYRRWL